MLNKKIDLTLRVCCELVFVFSFVLSSCAYRFTNLFSSPPQGIKTIAVEAVYDTGHEVIPHDILWSNLQRAFAKNGRLKLTSQNQADAYLRVHIKKADVSPAGSTSKNDVYNSDPDVYKTKTPPKPNRFRILTQAGEYTTKELISMVARVEVWDLRNRTLLLEKSYSGSTLFTSTRDESITPKSNHFLRFEEAKTASLDRISENLANKVVEDLLIQVN